MNYGEGGLSASDVALIQGGGRSNDGFGGENGSWWIIIFLIFAIFGGFGNRGGGFGGGSGSSGATDNYVLASDFSQISRQISDSTNMLERRTDNIINGLCDGFYTQAQLVNGVNTNILTSSNALQSQLANCCCDIRADLANCCCTTQRAIDGVNYNLAKGICDVTTNATMNTRDILESQNNNTRAILDALTANRIEDKNAQIQAQQNEINALRLAASQERQNAYLLNELKPCPSAAYIVPNPNCCYDYQVTRNNCGCGCN